MSYIPSIRKLSLNQIVDIAKKYEEKGDSVSKSLFLSQRGQFGWTALFEQDFDVTKELIDAGMDVNLLSNFQENALAHTKDIKTAKLLINSGINIHQINKDDENMIFRSNAPKTRLLIEKGINIHHVSSWSGGNALFTAKDDVIPLLIESGVDIYCLDKRGLHPAFVANEKTLPYFFNKGYNINTEINHKTLISSASHCRNYDLVAFLIKNGSDYYKTNRDGLYFFEVPGPYANQDTPFDFKKLYKKLQILTPGNLNKYSNEEILDNIRLELEKIKINEHIKNNFSSIRNHKLNISKN